NTPYVPQGPAVLPGKYTVRLTANGRTVSQTLTVRMDPRVTTSTAGLQQQFALSKQAYEGIFTASKLAEGAKKLVDQLKVAREKASKDAPLVKDIDALAQKLNLLISGSSPTRGTRAQTGDFTLSRIAAEFTSLLELLEA